MKTKIQNLLDSQAGIDTLPLRVAGGVIFAAHGAQKLFGWFGGYGLEGTAGWMESIGLGPGLLMSTLAGGAEFFAGLLLIIGLLVRPAALLLAVTMLVAIAKVHLANGLFLTNNGYEFGLALLVISADLFIRGASSFRLDNVLAKRLAANNKRKLLALG